MTASLAPSSRVDAPSISVAMIVPATEAEGPGRRFALWVQGCPLRCPGCCNPEMLAFAAEKRMPLGDVLAALDAAHAEAALEGITLLGGEPLAHAASLLPLARGAHARGMTVMAFTGFLFEELKAIGDAAVDALLAEIDILVDGPYRADLPETARRWIGSQNQRVLFLSDRADRHDPRWQAQNTLEIRWHEGALSVNGFPAKSATSLWRRVPQTAAQRKPS